MAWFEYEGLTAGGTAIAGRLEAADREQASEDLAGMQIDVRDLRLADPPPRRTAPLSADDLVFFNQQLASLAEAGIALDEGLAQLARDVESPKLRQWIEGLVDDLKRGRPIDQASAEREQGLPVLYSRVLRAGIESGELSATLLNLNHHLRLAGQMRRAIWELVSYPLVVVTLALSVLLFFFVCIIPQFKEIFRDFGTTLPGMTMLLINTADHFTTIVLIVGLMVLGIVLGWNALRLSSGGRVIREAILLALPVIGRVYRSSLISSFLRSVSTAVATGIPLPQAIRLSGDATGSVTLMGDAERLASETEQGQSIFVANQSSSVIPPLFGYCVQVASGRGTLPEAIAQLAVSYERRATHAQQMVRTLLAPLLVVVLGGFVGFVIMGMFLPLVSLINSVSGGG